MTDVTRPMPAETELRSWVSADATDLPVVSVNGFRPDARKLVGDEFVECSAFVTDATGWPVMTGCSRGVAREDNGTEPRPHDAGTRVSEVGWSDVDIVTAIPDPPSADMVGRQFVYRDGLGRAFTFNVVTLPDGVTPVIDWVNAPPADADAPVLTMQTAVSEPDVVAVAVDPSGNLYTAFNVSGGANMTLTKYNASLVEVWSTTFAAKARGGMAADATSVYIASDNDTDLIYKRLTSTGAAGTPASFGGPGSGNGKFNSPTDVVSNGTHVWVVDRENDRIQKMTVAGVYVSQFGGFGSGDGQFRSPEAIALAGGKLYVLDTSRSDVQRFDAATHAHEATFVMGLGNADGQLGYLLAGIAVDGDGNIWIGDVTYDRVQMFDATGVFVAKIGSLGAGEANLDDPQAIAVSGSVVYVADRDNDRVAVIAVPSPFTPDVAAPLDGDLLRYDSATETWRNVTIRLEESSVNVGNNSTNSTAAVCDAGETLISGGCDFVAGPAFWLGGVALDLAAKSVTCRARNSSSGGGQTLTAQAVCLG